MFLGAAVWKLEGLPFVNDLAREKPLAEVRESWHAEVPHPSPFPKQEGTALMRGQP
jgi:hypothetical protein